jgi:sugar diacid utilization regulator
VRLRTLLDMPDLQLRLLVGPDEVARTVRWVYTTDLRDPRRYLSGGELVLTGLAWWHGPEDSEAFVSALAQAGVTALGVGYAGIDSAAVPDDLVVACRRHRLPLIEVPVDVSFATITERVLTSVAAPGDSEAGTLLRLHRTLHAAPADAGGVAGICDVIAGKLDARCWVLSPTGRVVAGTGESPPESERHRLVRRALITEHTVDTLRSPHPYAVLPTTRRSPCRVAGWFLVVAGDPAGWPDDARDLAVEAASLVGLQQARQGEAGRLRAELAEGLVRLALTDDPNPTELASRLEVVGLNAEEPLVVLSASAAGGAPELLHGVLTELLEPISKRVAVASLGAEAIGLAATDLGRVDAMVAALQSTAALLEPGLSGVRLAIGVSAGSTTGPVLRGAIEEARHARRLAEHRAGTCRVVSSDELTSHTVLLAAVPEELRRSYRSRLLGPILEYDARHHSDLVRTLTVFLEHSGSWNRCAARLHLHVNTLRYRIARIEQLTGRDLSSFDDQVDLYLALRLG